MYLFKFSLMFRFWRVQRPQSRLSAGVCQYWGQLQVWVSSGIHVKQRQEELWRYCTVTFFYCLSFSTVWNGICVKHSGLMVSPLYSASNESASSPSLTFFTHFIFAMFSDVDECTVGSHFCDDICQNTLGSFTCHCRTGYRLMADLKTCLGTETVFLHCWCFICS